MIITSVPTARSQASRGQTFSVASDGLSSFEKLKRLIDMQQAKHQLYIEHMKREMEVERLRKYYQPQRYVDCA